MEKINVLWFKKDLRVHDHAALSAACQHPEKVIGLFCFEPSIMAYPDWSVFHEQAYQDSLLDLRNSLQGLHIPLVVMHADPITALKLIGEHYVINTIFAHEETGNTVTFERDRLVRKWVFQNKINIIEFPTNGVVRGLKRRDERAAIRRQRMALPCIPIPSSSPNNANFAKKIQNRFSDPSILKTGNRFHRLQRTGESCATKRLEIFLDSLVNNYLYNISSPYKSIDYGSRLSVFLTYGNLSIRQVYQATLNKRKQVIANKEADGGAKRNIDGFLSRLHRHCHFIQKLESEPSYELKNIHPYYDSIGRTTDKNILHAFASGETGIPLVDASIKCLHKTGWINFRMRAMLVSFICNTCFQDWKAPAHILARLFTDYEPGIHYAQFQMQSGTTGINKYRIYNPIKQAIEKDQHGAFIDMWLPALRHLPMPVKAHPRTLRNSLFESSNKMKLGEDYPYPIVDVESSNRVSKKKLRDLKKQDGFQVIADKIYEKHGSRKKSVAS